MIITHVNAYNAKQYTCTCQSSNQFNKQGISELLVYIKKRNRHSIHSPPFLTKYQSIYSQEHIHITGTVK